MTEKEELKGLKSEARRRFLALSTKVGFTTAAVAMSVGALGSSDALATGAIADEEKERQKRAKYTMNLATPYILGASRAYPVMQMDFKENIQNATNGQVYVKLAPGGQLGAEGALVQKVQAGTIQAAEHSIANFAPFAPAVDVINIPYCCGQNQQFINLVTSKAWKQEVDPKIEAKGFKALWYVCIDPRTIAIRRGVEGPIKTPEQMRGIKFRVPGSKLLQKFYQLIGANPTPVAWSETPSAIKQGVADGLDSSVEALLVYGFKDILSCVTFNAAVPDAQVYSCNLEWFKGLPKDVQDGVVFASEMTSRQNLAKVPASRAYAMAEMAKAGVKFHVPTPGEKEMWVAQAGAQLPAWDDIKKELVGSLTKFGKLEEAANTFNNFYVHDV